MNYGFIKPQLAETHPKGTSLDSYDPDVWYAEPKWDGIRLGVRIEGTETRAWSRLGNMKSLPAQIAADLALMPDGYYDGELVVPGGKSWNVAASEHVTNLRLVLFDLIEVLGHDITAMPQNERNKYLATALTSVPAESAVMASWHTAPSRWFYDEILRLGGEGMMLKRNDSPYRPGYRSQAWLKVKEIIEEPTTIVGFEKGESGPYSAVRVRLASGVETTVKTKTNEWLRRIAAAPDSFIGLTLTIAFQLKTDDGKPRHPRWATLEPHE